jgi:DNA-binding transcriptional MerR regulator
MSSAERAPQARNQSAAAGTQDRRAPARAPRRAEKSADAFRTISEVADELEVPQHVLRFWETKFTQIRPLKRGGGRRYYRPEDIDLLRAIRGLLYDQGYTIKGVQKLIRDGGLRLGGESLPDNVVPAEPTGAVARAVETAQEIMDLPLFRSGSLDDGQVQEIRAVATELAALRDRLRRALDPKPALDSDK